MPGKSQQIAWSLGLVALIWSQSTGAEPLDCGTAEECWETGSRYEYAGRLDLAEAHFERACELGDGSGCLLEAEMVLETETELRPRLEAWEVLLRICSEGWTYACERTYRRLGALPNVPVESYARLSRSVEGCRQGIAWACHQLGRSHQRGRDVPQSFSKAIHYFEKACKIGEARSCQDLGYMARRGQGGPPDDGRAARYLRKACDQGLHDACGQLGFLLLHGEGFSKDVDEAMRLLLISCRAGSGPACTNLGGQHWRLKDIPSAATFYAEALRYRLPQWWEEPQLLWRDIQNSVEFSRQLKEKSRP